MPIYSSDSDNEVTPRATKLFGRQRPIHSVLGGGKVADVLLWRNPKVSAALMIGMTVIWYLFEVVEYNFVTLLCHLSITVMLVVFIWFNAADFFNWTPPGIPEIILRERTFREVATTVHAKFIQTLQELHHIACGRDRARFFLALLGLSILSVIGNYLTFLNFLYLGYVCLQTLPFLYERYEKEVDNYANRLNRQVMKLYRKFDSNFLNKIPRGPVKEKKVR
ncbi:hypothetical protein K2173_026387 [Erythroxylum novogranatense]|uniref:Reticulon-like protein n=1 Tax=Erythroxylum novogranatense TaxID=1862640 RepID=A0AAV8SN17_9ROSI|nr:hypothetical protein K2173_026387 [Erythroxylum novogranatense]